MLLENVFVLIINPVLVALSSVNTSQESKKENIKIHRVRDQNMKL